MFVHKKTLPSVYFEQCCFWFHFQSSMFSQPPGGTSAGAPVFLPRSKNTHIWLIGGCNRPLCVTQTPPSPPTPPPDPDYEEQLTVYMSMDRTKSSGTCLVCRISWTSLWSLFNLRWYSWHKVDSSLFQAILIDKNEDVSFQDNDILRCIQHLWTINIALKSVVKTLFSQSASRESHPEGARPVVHSHKWMWTWHKWSLAGFFSSV